MFSRYESTAACCCEFHRTFSHILSKSESALLLEAPLCSSRGCYCAGQAVPGHFKTKGGQSEAKSYEGRLGN